MSNRNLVRCFYLRVCPPVRWVRPAVALIACLVMGCNAGVQQRNMAGTQAYQSGQAAQAINQFQQALQANPRDANAYYNLAATYYASGKQSQNNQWLQQAEQLYRQAISLNNQHVDAHRGLAGLLIETNREKSAFELMNQWIARHPNSAAPTIELARLYQEYGDTRRATDLLSDALRMDAGNVRALTAMGHVREIQGQADLALDNYLRVLQIQPQQTEIAQRVAALQQQLARGSNPVAPAPRYGAVNPYLPR